MRDETLAQMFRAIHTAPASWLDAVTRNAADRVAESDPQAHAALMGARANRLPSGENPYDE